MDLVMLFLRFISRKILSVLFPYRPNPKFLNDSLLVYETSFKRISTAGVILCVLAIFPLAFWIMGRLGTVSQYLQSNYPLDQLLFPNSRPIWFLPAILISIGILFNVITLIERAFTRENFEQFIEFTSRELERNLLRSRRACSVFFTLLGLLFAALGWNTYLAWDATQQQLQVKRYFSLSPLSYTADQIKTIEHYPYRLDSDGKKKGASEKFIITFKDLTNWDNDEGLVDYNNEHTAQLIHKISQDTGIAIQTIAPKPFSADSLLNDKESLKEEIQRLIKEKEAAEQQLEEDTTR